MREDCYLDLMKAQDKEVEGFAPEETIKNVFNKLLLQATELPEDLLKSTIRKTPNSFAFMKYLRKFANETDQYTWRHSPEYFLYVDFGETIYHLWIIMSMSPKANFGKGLRKQTHKCRADFQEARERVRSLWLKKEELVEKLRIAKLGKRDGS